jgi:hypothetical protein
VHYLYHSARRLNCFADKVRRSLRTTSVTQ